MWLFALLVAGLMAAIAVPARAAALPPPLGGVPPLTGLPSLGLGIVDDPLLGTSSGAVQNNWYGRARSLGSGWVRIGVVWAVVAPYTLPRHFRAGDPGSPYYHWTDLDRAVRAAAAYGQTPMLNIHNAPRWAEGAGAPAWAGPGAWIPRASAFAAFGRALALRYSGHFPDPLHRGQYLPRVRYLQAWNEPNLLNYLAPQWARDARGHIIAYSPILYRSMLNAFYAAVKQAVPGDVVFAAGTAPFGDPPGVGRMEPKTFLEGLFCLTGRLGRTSCPGGPAHLDGLDHHVYSPPWYSAELPNDISTPDLGRIWSVLNAARRAHTVVPNGPKPLWITEVGASANPPDAANYALQARYLELDLYVFWRQHVSNVFWFSIGDPGMAAGAFFSQVGLFTGSGAAKPAAAAYRFPFVAVPADRSHIVLWGKAPGRGTVRIERLYGRRWRTVARLHAGANRIFVGRISGRGTPEFRAVLGRAVSLPFVTGDS